MFECILVPLDGSADAEAALPIAEAIPSERVRLLAVASESTELAAMCAAARDCHAYLEQVAEPLRRQGRTIDTTVVFGHPAKEIVAAAVTADLVVMGSQGRGALGRAILGSIADWVARRAPVPTLIVRGGQRPATAMPLIRIVVPLDGSSLAEQALPLAITLGGDLGLPVHLVRVVDFDPVRASVEAGPVAAEACARQQAALVREANAYLAEQVLALRNRACVATSEVRDGAPAGELLAAIREGDLVVLTTHTRGGLERTFLGSVAAALVQHAAAPVLLMRATAGGSDQAAAHDAAVLGRVS